MFDIKETAAGETTFRASATYFGEICFSPFQPSPDSDHGPNLSLDMTGPSSKLIFYALEIVICPNVCRKSKMDKIVPRGQLRTAGQAVGGEAHVWPYADAHPGPIPTQC